MTLTFTVPLVCPGLVPETGPLPEPPVADSGVHDDTWNVILPAFVVSDSYLHCAVGAVSADDGMASGTATSDAVAAKANSARAPTESFI